MSEKDPKIIEMSDAHAIDRYGIFVSQSKTRQKLARKMVKKGLW